MEPDAACSDSSLRPHTQAHASLTLLKDLASFPTQLIPERYAQNTTQWVTTSNWQHLAGMLWKDMRLLAVRLDNAQRLAMCWVRPAFLCSVQCAVSLRTCCVLETVLWKDVRLLAVRLDNAQRLGMGWAPAQHHCALPTLHALALAHAPAVHM